MIETVRLGTSCAGSYVGEFKREMMMMAKHRASRGLTLAEVLVLVSVLAFLMMLLIPMLHRRRVMAARMTCATQLSGLGKAMLIYANDYYDVLPRAGGFDSQWTGRTPDWAARDRVTAFGLAPDGTGGEAGVSASLYLLVKYGGVAPKAFICGGDTGTPDKGMEEFRLGMYPTPHANAKLIDFWDFGPSPWRHCSYAYGTYSVNMAHLPGFVIAADRNPWIDSPSAKAGDFTKFRSDIPPFGGTSKQACRGNSPAHHGDGQNVLFLDSHVEFARRAYCGLDDDNIYTISSDPAAGDPLGTPPTVGSQPANKRDSLLVNDPPVP